MLLLISINKLFHYTVCVFQTESISGAVTVTTPGRWLGFRTLRCLGQLGLDVGGQSGIPSVPREIKNPKLKRSLHIPHACFIHHTWQAARQGVLPTLYTGSDGLYIMPIHVIFYWIKPWWLHLQFNYGRFIFRLCIESLGGMGPAVSSHPPAKKQQIKDCKLPREA